MKNCFILWLIIGLFSSLLPVHTNANDIDPSKYYYIHADTVKTHVGYLRVDSTLTDHVLVDNVKGDYALWRFELSDTTISYDNYYIINAVTGDTLAFDLPTTGDEPAVIQPNAMLSVWFDLFTDDAKPDTLITYSDVPEKYYLTFDYDNVVQLSTNTTALNKILFRAEQRPDFDDKAGVVLDSARVYKIKYLTGTKKNTFAGFDYDGASMYLDTVFVNVPDGQFIVNRSNTRSLISRALSAGPTDTIFYLYDLSGNLRPDIYLYNNRDTVEIIPITDTGLQIKNPYLGYKYITEDESKDYCYYFSCSAPDSLKGRILGADTAVMLLAKCDTGKCDTALFILDIIYERQGAAIDQIVSLQKQVYRLRSIPDTTLFMSEESPVKMTNTTAFAASFYIKESQFAGEYYLVRAFNSSNMLIIDKDKRLIQVPKYSSDTTLFKIQQLVRPPIILPDHYTYLKQFPESKGKGFYEFMIEDTVSSKIKMLTKDFYDYAALGLEGESMLRAGSYTPYDLQLWTDTAIGYVTNVNKPSFYIVNNADTTSAGANNFYIQGYFLHVMDSTMLASHNDYVVHIDGNEYNRLNFVSAKRTAYNQLTLATGKIINNTPAINEYRFYFQETDDDPYKYYLVTEEGLGDGRRSNLSGYLSAKNDTLYVGPRKNALKIAIRGSTVSNEFVPPLQVMPEQEITIVGGNGQIDIFNAAGQQVSVYNLIGRQLAQQSLTANHETIPIESGILIVKVGTVTQKVICY